MGGDATVRKWGSSKQGGLSVAVAVGFSGIYQVTGETQHVTFAMEAF